MSTIKSFRGKITDGDIETLSLHTNTGKIGYKITKFQIMPFSFDVSDEYSIKVFSINQTGTPTATFDFEDHTMLAAAFIETITGAQEGVNPVIVFDNVIFNQDISITCAATAGSNNACNYYLELEQIKLSDNEATMSTLRDIKNITSSRAVN